MGYGELKQLTIVVLAALSPACTAQPTWLQAQTGARPGSGAMHAAGLVPPIVTDFSSLVQKNGDAVVNISTTGPGRVSSIEQVWPPAGSDGNPFFRLFPQFPYEFPGEVGMPSGSVGSGFVISSDGYILTNSHVLAGSTKIRVTLRDGREFKAKLVGSDAASGVALLKIPATNMPTVRIGSTADAKAGNWIASIGNPYGLSNTVTAGIIANMSRAMPHDSYIPLIQTDMTESAGDAGSPVFNLSGEVIGIETPVHGIAGEVDGLAFALPINEAMRVEHQLQRYHKAEHGRLGITIQEVSGPLAQSFGLTKPEGALVSSVDANGPSAKSGLRPGDVILKLDDTVVADSSALPVAVADLKPGVTVQLVYWRDHATHDTSVVLGELNASAHELAGLGEASSPDGLTVRGLTNEERHDAGVKSGVRVERSVGPAAYAGIKPGDIILMVNDAAVASPDQFRQKVESAGSSVALLVDRNRERIFVTIDTS